MAGTGTNTMLKNAITVDVEDYFQVSAFDSVISRDSWNSLEHRIVANMQRIFEIFSEDGIKATFFMLGWIAERYPDLVRQIVDQGHELASHGHGHQRVTDLSKPQFANDITRSKKTLEDISGIEIRGYRAPSYSIGETSVWAFAALADAGFEYSSSIYPIRHDHYGFPGAPRFAFRDARTGLVEIPITTISLLKRIIPAGGGGFFRFYPYLFSRWIIDRVNRIDRQPAVFYFHPWELDSDQPRQQRINIKTRFRHYLNLGRTESRLKRLVRDFDWGRMDQVFLSGHEIPEYPLS